MRILKKLFTEEDARMALCLTRQPETVSVIAGRRGMGEAEAAALLESMVRRGLIARSRAEDGPGYRAMPFLVGIYEGQLATIDLELAEMMKEYSPCPRVFMVKTLNRADTPGPGRFRR